MALSKRYIRWVNILLGTVFLLPVTLAFLFYQNGGNYLGKINKGHLITPVISSDQFNIEGYDKKKVALKKKWTVLYHVSRCDEACESVLDKILRVRLALGRDMVRTHAALVTQIKASDELVHLMKEVTKLDTKPLLLKASDKLVEHQIYIVDPLGNLMMRYQDSVPPKHIHQDLIRLLKVSNIG